jgi:hypothetical protein
LARASKKKPARKSAPKKRAARVRTAAPATAAAYRAKIRMYRQGLGDCFLISLPRTDGSSRPFYVMIDCGVVLGTADPGTIMTKVMDHIVATTGGEIDLLIATHEHWDHVSGFVQAKPSFDRLKVGQVWLAWTEDPKDTLTQELKQEKGHALAALRMGLSQLQMGGDSEAAEQLGSILEFFGAARGPTTAEALANVRAKVGTPRYCLPGDPPVVPPGVSARFYVLGPPHDKKMLHKINPSASNKETYGLAMGLEMFMDGAGTAFGDQDEGRPFDQQYEIPFAYARTTPELEFFRKNYWQPDGSAPEAWRRIDGDWLGGASEMALQLDSLTNNTSLVLALELAPDGDVLLFAADAQVGNWLSWQDLKWTVGNKTVSGPDLLSRAIFYKVGHHGSHNATLKGHGVEEMDGLKAAIIPVDEAEAKKKHWGSMPLPDLIAALEKKAPGMVLRTDQEPVNRARNVVIDDKYFEVIL